MLVLSAGPASTDTLQPLAAGVDDEPPPEPRGPDSPPVLSRYDPSVEQWRSQIWQGMPDSLKSRPDAATLLDKTLHAVQGESSGDPGATGDGGIAHGLFQSHYVGAGATPQAQIADAWRLVQGDIAGDGTGFGDWGEGRSYQGQPFGAFGRTPYGAGDPLAQHLSTGQTSSFIPGPSIAPQPFSPYVPQPDPFATTGAEQQMQYQQPQQDTTPYQPYVGSDLQQHLSTGGPRLLDVTNPSDYQTLQEQVEGATAPPQEGYTYDPNVMQSRANSVLGPSDNPLGKVLNVAGTVERNTRVADIPYADRVANFVGNQVNATPAVEGYNIGAGLANRVSNAVGGPRIAPSAGEIASAFVPRNIRDAALLGYGPAKGALERYALGDLPEVLPKAPEAFSSNAPRVLNRNNLPTDLEAAMRVRQEAIRAGMSPYREPAEPPPGAAPGPTDVGRPARPGMSFQPVGGGAPTPAEEAAQGVGRALPAGTTDPQTLIATARAQPPVNQTTAESWLGVRPQGFGEVSPRVYAGPDGVLLQIDQAKNRFGRIDDVPGTERPLDYVYRAVSEAELRDIQATGRIKSNESMNVMEGEGTVAATYPAGFYLPSSQPGYYLKIRVDPGDGWHANQGDKYIKTQREIPLNRVVDVVKADITMPVRSNQGEAIPPTARDVAPTGAATPPTPATTVPAGTAAQPTTTNAPTPVTTTTQQPQPPASGGSGAAGGGAAGGGAAKPPPAAPAPTAGQLPPIGDSGIKDALARKEEATLTPGQVFGPEGNLRRRVAGAINPSVDLPRSVHVANQARTAVQATLRTEFSRAEMPAYKGLAEAFDAEKPKYTGPDKVLVNGKFVERPLKNTWVDYAENPGMYDASPKLEAAKDAMQAAGTQALAKARGEYGVDIDLLHPGQDPAAVYVPHMQARDDLEKAVESTSKSLSSKQGIAKERGYPTLSDRMARNPDWKPELDPAVLADLHASSLASMAANNTFKAGVGGKTLTEVMEEQHPGLDKARQAAQGKISGAKQSIARAEAAAKTAGITQEALDREIAGVRRRQGAAAGRMQDVEDQLPELTAMRNEVAELQARARAIARLTAKAGTLNTAATAGGEAARSALEAEAKRIAGLFEGAHDASLRRIAPDVLLSNKLSPVERTKLREVWSRLKAMDDLAARAGNQGAAAARAGAAETRGNAQVQKLMDDVAEIAQEAVGSTNPADVDHAITGLEGRIRRLEDQLLARASGAAESQQALRGVEGSLHNASEVQRIRQAAQEAKAAIGQARLPALQATVENARGRYRTAAIEGYELNRSTYRYHEPVVNRAIDSVLKPATFHNAFIDAALKAGNLLRAIGLGPDFSPLTIQGLLGALSHPDVMVQNAANFVKIFNSDEALQKLLDPALVRRYEFASGRPLGSASEDLLKSTVGPKLGPGNRPIKRFNDALERVLDYGSLKAFEADSKILQSGRNGLPQNVADAEAENALSKMIPRINNAAQGRSPQRVAVEGALPTSRSFTVQPFALAKDFVSGAAKLTRGAAGKIPGVSPGPELSGREDLAIIRGIALLGSLMTISITSALLSAEANKKDPVQAVKEVMDPSSGKFFNLILGNQGSIGLGGPMRSAFLGVWRTMTQGPQGGINYARSRLEPVLGAGVDVVSNTDFRGNPVRTGSPWNQMLQSAVHIAQGANLLGGGISQGYGESGVQGAAEQAVSGLGGVNYQERSQYEKRDLIARQGIQVKQPDGSTKLMKANSYQSASPLLKDAINKMNVTDLSDYRKASDTVHQTSKAEVSREEDLFNKGQNDQALRDVYQREGERNRALATSLENQFASQFAGFDKSKYDNAVEGYYALSQAKENQIPEGELGAGGIDFDKVASAQKDYLANLPADQRQWVSEALQVAEANKTPLHQEYDKYIDAKKQAGYFVTHIDPVTKRPTGITPQERQALDIAHPDLDVASWRFGSVGGKAGSALNSPGAVQMALGTPDAQNKEITYQGLPRPINQSPDTIAMWKYAEDPLDWYLTQLPNGQDAVNEGKRLADNKQDKEYLKPLDQMDPQHRTTITDNLHRAALKSSLGDELEAYLYAFGERTSLTTQAAADKAAEIIKKYKLDQVKAPMKKAA